MLKVTQTRLPKSPLMYEATWRVNMNLLVQPGCKTANRATDAYIMSTVINLVLYGSLVSPQRNNLMTKNCSPESLNFMRPG